MHHQAFSSDLWKKKERKNEGKKRVSDFPTRENIIVIYWKSNTKLLWNAFFSREREGREIILIPITWKFALFSPLIAYSIRINHEGSSIEWRNDLSKFSLFPRYQSQCSYACFYFFFSFFYKWTRLNSARAKIDRGFRTPELLSRAVASGNFHTRRVQWVR